MDSIVEFLSTHASQAHWYIFIGVLLAGCNIPVSIDALVIIAALLAAQFVPENLWILFNSLFIGCCLSAWISYSTGRLLGQAFKNKPFFQKIFPEKRITSMQNFYQKYGLWAFILGRFIPFGARNALFLTSGMSRIPFARFAFFDSIACLIWVSTCFSVFFHLGQNFEKLWEYAKAFNTYIFLAFSIAVIAIFWYKRLQYVRSQQKSKSS